MSEIKIIVEKTINPLGTWETASCSFSNSYVTYFNNNGFSYTSSLLSAFTGSTELGGVLTIPISINDLQSTGSNIALSWNINPIIIEPINSAYWYRLSISGSSPTISSSFNPSVLSNINLWDIKINDPILNSNALITPTNGNYWNFYSDINGIQYNKIILESISGNIFYNKNYIQNQIPYISGSNSHFKGGFEPSDIQFPNIIDQWNIEIGDEIRFENDESECYNVLDIKTYNYNLLLILDRDIKATTNLNFFIIRRYKESPDNVIINQSFPYTNPLISSSLAPTTSGFIFPKYPIDSIATGSNKIILDLIDKKIIE